MHTGFLNPRAKVKCILIWAPQDFDSMKPWTPVEASRLRYYANFWPRRTEIINCTHTHTHTPYNALQLSASSEHACRMGYESIPYTEP